MAENSFLISRTFLHSCDKTTRIDRIFTDFNVLIPVYFPVSLFKNTFLLYFSFPCPQIYHLINNSSSTEVVNIACDFVYYGGENVCRKPICLKTTEILRSNAVVAKEII